MSWFQVNLAGVQAASAGARALPEGFYTGTILGAEPTTTQNGKAQIAIKVQVTGGEHDGIVRTTRIGVPTAPDDKVLVFWRAAFESMGYTPAQIEAGPVTVSAEIMVGRSVSFYYKPGDKEAGVYEDFRFLTPTDFASRKAAFEAGKSAQGSALGAASIGSARAVSTPAPASLGMGAVPAGIPTNGMANGLGGGNTVTRDGLLAALNRAN
jgi:hypothetical protein